MHRPLKPALLRRMAVQFQSEWDGQSPDICWGWVERMWANPVQHEAQALKTKLTWMAAQKVTWLRGLAE